MHCEWSLQPLRHRDLLQNLPLALPLLCSCQLQAARLSLTLPVEEKDEDNIDTLTALAFWARVNTNRASLKSSADKFTTLQQPYCIIKDGSKDRQLRCA